MLAGLLCDFQVGSIPVAMEDPDCPATSQFSSLYPCMAMVACYSIFFTSVLS